MSQLFHRRSNILVRGVLVILIALVIALALSAYFFIRSPAMTGVGVAQAQPIPYSHQQHVGGLGLDCRYCHSTVDQSNTASIPATDTCMGCHRQIATDSDILEPVRASAAEGQPLTWLRVHDLPDHVYFNHAIHVRQGVGCETCHGRVDQMPIVVKTQPLHMAWCLDCHREPERYLRPRSEVTTMGWEPPVPQEELGSQLVAEYGIQVEQLSDCSICHR